MNLELINKFANEFAKECNKIYNIYDTEVRVEIHNFYSLDRYEIILSFKAPPLKPERYFASFWLNNIRISKKQYDAYLQDRIINFGIKYYNFIKQQESEESQE
jgi:hypothetical protein